MQQSKIFGNDMLFYCASDSFDNISINASFVYQALGRFLHNPYWILKILLTYAMVLSLQGVIYILTYRDFTAHIVTAILFFFMDFVTQTMYAITGDPLLPTDLLLVGDLKTIVTFAKIPITYTEIGGLILIIINCLMWFTMQCRFVIQSFHMIQTETVLKGN